VLKATPVHPCTVFESEKLSFLLQLAMLEWTWTFLHPEMDEYQPRGEDPHFWRE